MILVEGKNKFNFFQEIKFYFRNNFRSMINNLIMSCSLMQILLVIFILFLIINVNLFICYMDQLFDSYQYLEINLLKRNLALLSKLIKNYFFINSTKVRDEINKFNKCLFNLFCSFL